MISKELVEYSAELAKIAISDDEAEELRGTLGALIGYVDALKNVETAETAKAETSGVLREDSPSEPIEREVMLANAPLRNEDSFVVPETF